MGCCVGTNRNINKNIDILLNPEKLIKNDENLNVNEEMTNFQIKQKTGKEEIKKEKSTLENNIPNIQSSNSREKEYSLKVNKKRAIKKGSQNIYSAMRKLKLLSFEELDHKQNFFP